MNQLINEIQVLNRDEAIEAALFLSNIMLTEDESTIKSESLIPDIETNPYAHITEIEDLARIILVNVSESSIENYELVKKAISSTGKKNIIFTTTEIILLAGIGLATLKMIINPITYKKKTFKDKNGVEITEEIIRDPNVNFLRSLYENLFK